MLSDSAIKEAIARGYITINPLMENAIQPASVDLRLGEKLLIQESSGDWREHNLRTQGPYRLSFGDFVLGQTHEWITLAPTGTLTSLNTMSGFVVGEMVGKSSRAREAIIVEAAGHFDPAWDGFGTLEISNRGRVMVVLEYLMPICQMRFHRVEGKIDRPYGHADLKSHYQLAMGPEVSFTQKGRVRVVPEPDPTPVEQLPLPDPVGSTESTAGSSHPESVPSEPTGSEGQSASSPLPADDPPTASPQE